jgi:succinate dehydrogenase / fumarate reductase cytochrome b subunit
MPTNSPSSSILRKIFMGVSGLMLSGFIVVHLLGNLTLLLPDGGRAFNFYAHTLHSLGTAIYVAEAILAAIFIVHIYQGIRVTYDNWRARRRGYDKVTPSGSPSRQTLASRTMIYTGILIVIFLVKHLIDLKFGSYFEITYDGVVMRDLYRTTVDFFQSEVNVILYTVIMLMLGFHLSHGVWSAFQSLGIDGPRFTPLMVTLGMLFAIVMAGGFIVIPVYLYFLGGTV